jgi:LPXTG-motif cell wall-anchored protein
MTRPADTRGFIRALLAVAGLLLAATLLLASAASPERALAQTGCSPAGDDTFVPGEPGEPPPGGVVVDPGEPCPETEPVPPPVAEELPPPPKCDPCPKRDQGQTASTGSGSTPVSSVQQLPFTGLDKERTTLVLSGFGLLAIGLGLAVRRRTFRA